MHALGYKNHDFISPEPFQGLFTQGMVCHETYKDENNKTKYRTKKNYYAI